MEAPNVGLAAVTQKINDRTGYECSIPGEVLPAPISASMADMFTAAQREHGITLRFNYLTANEELEALGDATRMAQIGRIAALEQPLIIMMAKGKKALVAIDDVPIKHLEKDGLWSALGESVRQLVTEIYSTANGVAMEARAKTLASFRVVA